MQNTRLEKSSQNKTRKKNIFQNNSKLYQPHFHIYIYIYYLSIVTFLQLILSGSYYRILVPGADTAEIVQRQIIDGDSAQTFRLCVGSLVPGRVGILVTDPNSIRPCVLVVRLVRVTAILLRRIADAPQTAHGRFGQPRANFRVRKKAWRVGVRPFSSRPVGNYWRHSWYLTLRRQLPRTGVRWNPNNDLGTRCPVLEPVPWNGIDTSPIYFYIFYVLYIFFLNYIYIYIILYIEILDTKKAWKNLFFFLVFFEGKNDEIAHLAVESTLSWGTRP